MPGSIAPASFTCASRLSSDSTRSPTIADHRQDQRRTAIASTQPSSAESSGQKTSKIALKTSPATVPPSDAADRALDGLARADPRRELALAVGAPGEVGARVAPHHDRERER